MGVIKIKKDEISEEEIFELAIEAGADECITKENFHEIQCSINEIYNVKKNLENKINNFISTEIEWLPLNSVKVSKQQQEKLIEFFETLEDDDDVQNIFSNVELKNKLMLIIGIDPGISGSICFFEDGKILDVVEMPTMTEGKKNKKQVNGSQIYNEILKRIKKLIKKDIKSYY